MEKIKILKIEEGKAPFVKEIANELKDCQAEVGGLIDCVCFEDGCLAVVNDEGKINGMKPNRRNGNDIICGPFVICGSHREGDFISLTVYFPRYRGLLSALPFLSVVTVSTAVPFV